MAGSEEKFAGSTAATAEDANLRWYQGLTRYMWIVLIIAALGWLFDSMDQNIFTLVREPAVSSLLFPHIPFSHLTQIQRAQVTSASTDVTSVFIIGWAVGGLVFGVLGDRLGRVRTMMLTITIYACFTGMSGLSHSIAVFGLFRFMTALGVGGEWAAGASLVAEVFPQRSRAMALGSLGALSAFGNMTAAVMTFVLAGIALPTDAWRVAFMVGFLPALLVIWIQRSVHEPERWVEAKMAADAAKCSVGTITELFTNPALRRNTLAATLIAAAGVGGLWGIGFWTPELTGRVLKDLHLSGGAMLQHKSYVFLVQQCGAFFGMFAYAAFSEKTDRRTSLLVFFLLSVAAIQGMFWGARSFLALMLWAPVLGFCTLGPFSAYTIYFPELFPTRLRSTGCGFCYNCARVLAALAPFALGHLQLMFEPSHPGNGFRIAVSVVSSVYILGLIGLVFAPETRGKPLPD